MATLQFYDHYNERYWDVEIDDVDLPRVQPYSFTRQLDGYYRTTVDLPNGKRKSVLLHRYIAMCFDRNHVHHIDCSKENNRRSNLLICTSKEHARIHGELNALIAQAKRDGRDIVKTIRWTPEEWAEVERLAQESGLTESEYQREAILGRKGLRFKEAQRLGEGR